MARDRERESARTRERAREGRAGPGAAERTRAARSGTADRAAAARYDREPQLVRFLEV